MGYSSCTACLAETIGITRCDPTYGRATGLGPDRGDSRDYGGCVVRGLAVEVMQAIPFIPNLETRPARYQGDLGEYLAEYYLRRLGFDVGRVGSKCDLLVSSPVDVFTVEVKSCTRPRTRSDGPDYYKFSLSDQGSHPDYYAFVALDRQVVVVEPVEDITLRDIKTRYFRSSEFTETLMRERFERLVYEHELL